MVSKRKCLILKEKIDIFKFWASNTNINIRASADKFSVSETHIVNIIVNKDTLYKIWAANEEEK